MLKYTCIFKKWKKIITKEWNFKKLYIKAKNWNYKLKPNKYTCVKNLEEKKYKNSSFFVFPPNKILPLKSFCFIILNN